MRVKVWGIDEYFEVHNRDEAIKVIKKELDMWMQEGDFIGWFMTNSDTSVDRKPSIACVVNELSEPTDNHAVILYD